MEFKGTKGRWTRYVSNTPNKIEPTAHSVYVGTKRIALCYDIFESDKSKNVSNIDAEANAKLIAAAPDLLEALLKLIDPQTGLVYDAVEKVTNKDTCYKIELAIEKALK